MPSRLKRAANEPNAEVFTPPDVVSYMLKAVETRRGRHISVRDRILEPSAGDGAFVQPIVEKMVASLAPKDWSNPLLDAAIRAYEVNPAYTAKLRDEVKRFLMESGCPASRTSALVSLWIHEEDFLSAEISGPFDVVVGNPPYVRYDAIGKSKVESYRKSFATFRGRCDLYIPFIERSLSLLSQNGVFCFICSNRFTKSAYGSRLRQFISNGFHVSLYLNLEHADVFGKDIAAYPAILMVDRRFDSPTYSATIDSLAKTPLSVLAFSKSDYLAPFPEWYSGDSPWATTDKKALIFSRRIEHDFPLLSQSAPKTRFGIGVATGNDAVFVVHAPDVPVESEALLPLATGDDIRSGRIHGDSFLVNPFRPDYSGRLRDISELPRLASYLESHKDALATRFVAKKKEWYRTIDRVDWSLFKSPKILLPDIQPGGVVGIDEKGCVYPHHNVYWITSEGWPLHLLAALLKSEFVARQIRWASVEMRGGSIRYQVQNLSRLRLPPREVIDAEDAEKLINASDNNDMELLNNLVNGIVERALDGKGQYAMPQQELLFAMEQSGKYRAKRPAR